MQPAAVPHGAGATERLLRPARLPRLPRLGRPAGSHRLPPPRQSGEGTATENWAETQLQVQWWVTWSHVHHAVVYSVTW